MSGVDPNECEFALAKIDDGFLFENFANEFLAKILGHSFSPVGGIKDRGIDGLEHVFGRDGLTRHVYQSSIEADPMRKLGKTLSVLESNKINYGVLGFVTNQRFPDQDKVIDDFFDQYGKPIRIYDLGWFTKHVNDSQATLNVYRTFVDSYLHEFRKPGKSFQIADLDKDPRLYVFLRQQWEANRKDLALDAILADTLILYCLEGTDPEKSLFRNKADLLDRIKELICFDPKLLHGTIEDRLKVLSTVRPRKVHYHSPEDAYCLPYETRLEIQQRNIEDVKLHTAFLSRTEDRLRTRLTQAKVRVRNYTDLIEGSIHTLFRKQGLEFSNFVLNGESQEAFEKDLPDIVASVVDKSTVIEKNREVVKSVLLMTIRDLVYSGSAEEKEFIRRLSSTYMMLFLLQCDPKVATYFNKVASELTIYVDNSIIIPALSEYFLEPVNRRHWNLLVGAREAGVTLVVNETIVNELAAHFRSIKKKYEQRFSHMEAVYLGDDLQTLYIDEIMIRAYFYSKSKGKVGASRESRRPSHEHRGLSPIAL